MKNISTIVHECLNAVLEKDLSKISNTTDLIQEGLDSINFIKFIILLEEALDFTLNDSDLQIERFSTIEKILERLGSYQL